MSTENRESISGNEIDLAKALRQPIDEKSSKELTVGLTETVSDKFNSILRIDYAEHVEETPNKKKR